MADDLMDSLDRIQAKRAEKEAKKKEIKAAEDQTPQKLVIERTPSGLYFVRNERSGTVPVSLRGLFTSVDKIRTLAFMYNKEIAE